MTLRFVLFLAAILAAEPTWVQGQIVIWNSGAGANQHGYQAVTVPGGIDWATASTTAITMGGHLASIDSAEENAFVFGLINSAAFWYVDSAGNGEGPWLGGFRPPGAAAGRFQWSDGTSFGFTAWSGGEPNNYAGVENRLVFFGPGGPRASLWNDVPEGARQLGFVVEFTSVPEPTTGILLALAVGVFAAARGRRKI